MSWNHIIKLMKQISLLTYAIKIDFANMIINNGHVLMEMEQPALLIQVFFVMIDIFISNFNIKYI